MVLSLPLSPIRYTVPFFDLCTYKLILFINFVEVRWEWLFGISNKEVFMQYFFATYSTSFFFVRDSGVTE